MSEIKDNSPPLPDELWHEAGCDLGQLVRQIEAAAFSRGVAAGQGEIERLSRLLDAVNASMMHVLCLNDELRAKLKELGEQKPVGEVDAMSYEKETLYLRPLVCLDDRFDELLGAKLYLAAGAKP